MIMKHAKELIRDWLVWVGASLIIGVFLSFQNDVKLDADPFVNAVVCALLVAIYLPPLGLAVKYIYRLARWAFS